MDTATHFKRMKFSTLIEVSVPVSNVEAHVVVFPLPQILAFPVEAVAVEPSTPIPEEIEFMDAFANLVLGRDPFVFPTLIENKR
jgi:hypothetical protein